MMSIWGDRWRLRKIDEYLAEHGSAPRCACGCGQPVGFDQSARPRTWAWQHWPRTTEAATRANRERQIDISDFRRVVRDLKLKKGWTWAEMAEQGGVSPSTLTSMMSRKRAKGVSKDFAQAFLWRLAGGGTDISSPRIRRRVQRLEEIEEAEWELERQYRVRG